VVEVWRPKPKARHHRIIFGGACSTNHRYGQNIGHDSSIRTPGLCWVRERLLSVAVWLALTMVQIRLLSM